MSDKPSSDTVEDPATVWIPIYTDNPPTVEMRECAEPSKLPKWVSHYPSYEHGKIACTAPGVHIRKVALNG